MRKATTTFKDVELVKVGTWLSGNGKVTITQAHLEGALAASVDDGVDHAVIKIGHDGAVENSLGDAHPALGWVENLKLSEDKQTLLGDLTSIPTKLADIAHRAFRKRSVEMDIGVTTAAGKKYAAALTALSLLGARAPAVKGLKDIVEVYASAGSNGALTAEFTAALSMEDPDTGAVPQVNAESGKTGHVEQTNVGTSSQENGGDAVANPAELRTLLGLEATATDEEVNAALTAQAAAATEAANAKATADADAAKVAADKAAADAAAATAAAAAAAGAGAAAPAEGGAALSGTEGAQMVTMTVEQFEAMNVQLSGLVAKDQATDREETLRVALGAGKISPAEVKEWRKALVDSPESTKALLSGIPARFGTVELGSAAAEVASPDDIDAIEKAAIAAGM